MGLYIIHLKIMLERLKLDGAAIEEGLSTVWHINCHCHMCHAASVTFPHDLLLLTPPPFLLFLSRLLLERHKNPSNRDRTSDLGMDLST
jgi:hypothetical protein